MNTYGDDNSDAGLDLQENPLSAFLNNFLPEQKIGLIETSESSLTTVLQRVDNLIQQEGAIDKRGI
jgi:hypothetical protein